MFFTKPMPAGVKNARLKSSRQSREGGQTPPPRARRKTLEFLSGRPENFPFEDVPCCFSRPVSASGSCEKPLEAGDIVGATVRWAPRIITLNGKKGWDPGRSLEASKPRSPAWRRGERLSGVDFLRAERARSGFGSQDFPELPRLRCYLQVP